MKEEGRRKKEEGILGMGGEFKPSTSMDLNPFGLKLENFFLLPSCFFLR
jgi:hypothetical protein